MKDKVRVLIVDDSALMREALKSILLSSPGIEVVGMAKDGKEGVEKALMLKPDVITMDLKMPILGGLEAIEEIMHEHPIPVIVVSTMDVEVIVKALEVGAMDFIAVTQDIEKIAKELVEKVTIASGVRPLRRMRVRMPPELKLVKKRPVTRVVAIGVSTGGPQALQLLLSKIPADFPAGILIVQHISEGFIDGLAEWLNGSSSLDIKIAKTGDSLKSATALLAPDRYNFGINEDGIITLSEAIGRTAIHVPSIDEMMNSVAAAYKEDAIGVLMTGMGTDGVKGMRAIKDAGGITIAQDEKSSVVFGMNKAAIESGCVDKIVPLEKIADEILCLVK